MDVTAARDCLLGCMRGDGKGTVIRIEAPHAVAYLACGRTGGLGPLQWLRWDAGVTKNDVVHVHVWPPLSVVV